MVWVSFGLQVAMNFFVFNGAIAMFREISISVAVSHSIDMSPIAKRYARHVLFGRICAFIACLKAALSIFQ